MRSILSKPHRETMDRVPALHGEIGDTPVFVARTGVGAPAARSATLALLARLEPAALIATGFAGATDPDLSAGDVLVAERVLDLPGPGGSTPPRTIDSSPELLAAARTAAGDDDRVRFGTLASTSRVVTSAEAKRRLHDEHGVDAVDMESLGIARAANVHDVPLLCVRAVVDDAATDLPVDIDRYVTADGRPRPLMVLWSVIVRPRRARTIADLARNAREAGEQLARYLERLVPAIGRE